jgi:hypothetical protein
MLEVRALQDSGHSERRRQTKTERAMWGILGASTHVLLIIAGECSNSETSAYLWPILVLLYSACQVIDWTIGSAFCRGLASVVKIGILQDLAAGPEQTNAAQLLVDTETPRKNASHSHV